MAKRKKPDSVNVPPFETADLRANLTKFLDSPFKDLSGASVKVGNYVWGVYAFFDYDGEPIYVGQTNERLRARIRRHLTNQRSDPVAMSVLDPFEVFEIEVWPLPQLQNTNRKDKAARDHLDALERQIIQDAVDRSKFKATLNEKDPPPGTLVWSRCLRRSAPVSFPIGSTNSARIQISGSLAALSSSDALRR